MSVMILYTDIVDDHCLNVSRHRPIITRIQVYIDMLDGTPGHSQLSNVINWKRVSNIQVEQYQTTLASDHDLVAIATNVLSTLEIDSAYDTITDKLSNYASEIFPVKKYKRHLKPYWNDELKQAHGEMKRVRDIWRAEDRPRCDDSDNTSYFDYKTAKSLFRRLHRRAVLDYMNKLDSELDQTAEIDSYYFWRLVKSRRKSSQSDFNTGINFNGHTIRDRRQIIDNWGLYFKSLYTPATSEDYDEQWRVHVNDTVMSATSRLSPDQHVTVLPETHYKAITACPSGKAGWEDNIQYEHLHNAKQFMSKVLANLFTHMLRNGYIPDKLKRGIIITIHKGGNKRTDVPTNQRAISLTSVILKLYETVLMSKSKPAILNSLSPQQGGSRRT